MTPEQALQVLVQLSALALASKQDHVVGEQAAQVLRDTLAAQPEGRDNADANGQIESHATQP